METTNTTTSCVKEADVAGRTGAVAWFGIKWRMVSKVIFNILITVTVTVSIVTVSIRIIGSTNQTDVVACKLSKLLHITDDTTVKQTVIS